MSLMIATWGAVVSAVAAAALWYWASRVTVKVRPFFGQDGYEEMRITKQIGDEVIDVLETASAQSRWNSYAAIAAALSALLQAIALLTAR